MKTKDRIFLLILMMILISFWPTHLSSQTIESSSRSISKWYLSFQYLGLTYHPGGGGSPDAYPLKFEKKGYLVPEVGVAANLDYSLSDSFFFRLTSALYKDCAFVTAGCIHAGPRIQYSWGDKSLNAGIGPIFSFREDWHRFKEYQDDEFYGNRVKNGWQYRFFGTAIELEYLRRITDSSELQWSLIPGAPLVITFMFGIRFKII